MFAGFINWILTGLPCIDQHSKLRFPNQFVCFPHFWRASVSIAKFLGPTSSKVNPITLKIVLCKVGFDWFVKECLAIIYRWQFVSADFFAKSLDIYNCWNLFITQDVDRHLNLHFWRASVSVAKFFGLTSSKVKPITWLVLCFARWVSIDL